MLIVQKFGGTSLEGRERIFAAARIITQAAKRGSRVVAVVSAQGQTTDEMMKRSIRKRRKGLPRPYPSIPG